MVDMDTVAVEIEIDAPDMYEIAARIQNWFPRAKLMLKIKRFGYEAQLHLDTFPFVFSGEGETPEKAFSFLERAVDERCKRAA